MEKSRNVDQKQRSVLEFVATNAALLCRQGSVHKSPRNYQGEKRGAYYRLTFRVGGRQRSLYLGHDAAFADAVRAALHELQAPLRERRAFARLRAQACAARRAQSKELDQELRRHGAYLKGSESRGIRNVYRALSKSKDPRGGP